jgi:hypothetical protein
MLSVCEKKKRVREIKKERERKREKKRKKREERGVNRQSVDTWVSPHLPHAYVNWCPSRCFVYVKQKIVREIKKERERKKERKKEKKRREEIGVNRQSVDTWVSPHLFRMHMSTGAPPYAFCTWKREGRGREGERREGGERGRGRVREKKEREERKGRGRPPDRREPTERGHVGQPPPLPHAHVDWSLPMLSVCEKERGERD